MIELDFVKKLNFFSGSAFLKINMAIPAGSFTGIYGPSGAGKTSILKMIAGLIDPDEGYLNINGTQVFNKVRRINVKPYERKTGYIFQDYALFPNFTVEENIKYALKDKGDLIFFNEIIETFEIGFLKKKNINQLSGGQKQRVSIARALVRKPEILLLDEPFSSLDDETRSQLQLRLIDIHKSLKITSIIVSHQKLELIKMCENVFIVENGKINLSGPPEIIFNKNPADAVIIMGEILNIVTNKEESLFFISGKNGITKVYMSEKESNEFSIGQTVQMEIKHGVK